MSNKRALISLVLAVAAAVGSALTLDGDSPCSPLVLGVLSGLLACLAVQAYHRWAGVLVTALGGLSVSLYLGVEKKGMADSFCSVSAVCDCGTVNASEHSMLMGIPIAFLGSAFYAGVAALALVAIRGVQSERYARSAHLIGLGALLSVAYSLFLAMASMDLGKWCLLCVSLYGVNLILLIGALGLTKGTEVGLFGGAISALKNKDDKSGGVALTSGIVVLVASMAWYGQAATGTAEVSGGEMSSAELGKLFVAPEGPMSLDGSEPVLGSPSAPYMVVEFADFECPACAATFDPLHALVKASSDVQLLFKHYPLSGICNDGIQGDRHANSCAAAVATDCAGEQGKCWELARLAFKNQRHLGAGGIDIMAGQLQLDVAKFNACRDKVGADLGVRSDVAAAVKVGVHATPSLYLKGVKGEEWVLVRGGASGLEALLDAHRSGAQLPPTPKAEPHSH